MDNVGLGVQKVDGLQQAVQVVDEPVNVELAGEAANADGEAGAQDVTHEAHVAIAVALDGEVVEQRGHVLRARVVRVQLRDVPQQVQLAQALVVGVGADFEADVARGSGRRRSAMIMMITVSEWEWVPPDVP